MTDRAAPRLSAYAAVTAVLLCAAWYFGNPADAAAFLDDPLMNLDGSPIVPLLGATAAMLGLAVLGERLPRIVSRDSWLPSVTAGGAAVFALPFGPASGLLFGCVLLATSIAWSLWRNPAASGLLATPDGVRGIFFVSGMAALVYQVAWQKKLISLIGADGQAVTVIVAVFLGGLGVGALVGDRVGRGLGARRCIAAFCAIELAAGLFGAVSMFWLEWIGGLASRSFSPLVMIASAAASLGLPTILMGMTLPILVEALKGSTAGLHENVGKLYALNALGSALASLLTATLVFRYTGLIGATWIAAMLNALTALLVFVAARHWGTAQAGASAAPAPADGAPSRLRLSWPQGALLAGLTGLITISVEVLILRMMSWSSGSAPWTFGFGVAAFLVGLGVGSLRIAATSGERLLVVGARAWTGTAFATLLMPAVAALLGALAFRSLGTLGLALTMASIGFLGGSSLPLISGQVRPDRSGNRHFGTIYAVNIAGSVSGAVATGYFAFDAISTDQCIAVFALLSLLTAGVFAGLVTKEQRPALRGVLAVGAFVLLALPLHGAFYQRWREWLYDGSLHTVAFADAVETRAGIIAVRSEPGGDDIMVGGGAYDGKFNADPFKDSNMIFRPYLATAMLPEPHKILHIGLGSGSWTKAILSYDTLQELTVIDINAGYTNVIADNPKVADILEDKRASFVIADARKWLQASDGQWQMIIVNNTHHWRDGATLLHSKEMMELARRHLAPDGILFLNATGAASIAATALEVFPEVYLLANGVIAVNGHLPTDSELLGRRLAQSRAFAGSSVASIAKWASDHPPILLNRTNYSHCRALTDDAMATEWGKQKCVPRT